MITQGETLVFVYGTLKRGASNHHEMKGGRFLGTAQTLAGWRLFLVADYPGLVARPGDMGFVRGELWAVDDALLRHLDVFEGVQEGLYFRQDIGLTAPYSSLRVQTYVYARETQGRADLDGFWPLTGA